MAKTNAKPNDEHSTGNAVNISDRAIDNLEFIRETMERSTHFTAVPGYGGMLMGVTAVVAAVIANSQIYLVNSLMTWLIEAVLAFSIDCCWRCGRNQNSAADRYWHPPENL